MRRQHACCYVTAQMHGKITKTKRAPRAASMRAPAPGRAGSPDSASATALPAALHTLSARLEEAREEERTVLSRRVHDELGQMLTSLNWEISWLGERLSTLPDAEYADVTERLEGMSELVGTLTQTVRKVASDLRPRVLDQFGLLAALEWQARDFESRYRIPCKVSASSKSIAVEGNVSTAIFRIFQEILTNIARHARATEVRAHLEENAGRIALVVHDNGRGFTADETPESLGILGMRERAMLLGGQLEVTPVLGEGTSVAASIPQGHPSNGNTRPIDRKKGSLSMSLNPSILDASTTRVAARCAH